MKQIFFAAAMFVATCTITVSTISAQSATTPDGVAAVEAVNVYKDAH